MLVQEFGKMYGGDKGILFSIESRPQSLHPLKISGNSKKERGKGFFRRVPIALASSSAMAARKKS